MDSTDMEWKIGLVQLQPTHSDVKASMAVADAMLEGIKEQVDLIIFPECAFTGYLFQDEAQARALSEIAGSGPTFDWCKKWTTRLNCGIIIGYIRLDSETENLFNSQMVVDPSGQFVETYDKHFLYDADKSWSQPGSGFKSFICGWMGGIRIGLGICMDINPYEFSAPWDAFEFANFHAAEQSDIIAFSSAWCNRHPDDKEASPIDSFDTQNYWFKRLRPLWKKNTYFLAADRVGKEPISLVRRQKEGDVTFVGSSCAIDLKNCSIIGHLDSEAETVLVVSIPKNRFASN